ncbi:SICA antigen, partial [Plasmodium coatneyi]
MYDYFAEFLVEWLTVKGMQSSGQYGKIWKDVERVFKDMLKYITKDSEELKLLCSGYGDDISMSEGVKNRGKELCKMLIRIIYWIGGLVEKWDKVKEYYWEKRTDIKEKNEKVEAYLRCILGKILIAKMFSNHCDMEEVAKVVDGAVQGTLGWRGIKAEHEECSGIDFGIIRIGHVFLWERMDGWLSEKKEEKKELEIIKKNGEVCEGGSLSRGGSKDIGKGKENTTKLLGKGSAAEWQELLKRRKQFPEDNLVGILKKMSGKDQSGMKSIVEQEVKNLEAEESKTPSLHEPASKTPALQEQQPQTPASPVLPVRPPPPPPPRSPSTPRQGPTGKDCSKEEDLCQRANCVAPNWFKDRNGNEMQNWCQFWNTDAVKRLNELSTDMTNGNKAGEELCKNFAGSSGKVTEAEKKACNYIVKGLKYIYGLQSSGEDVKSKNNRIISQTMYCLFLNAYADMLIEKSAGHICLITEEKIKEMFKEGNENKDTWCVNNKTKQNNNCATCTREPNLICALSVEENLFDKEKSTKCLSYNKNIKVKLDDLLEKNSEIQQTFTTINNASTLCERVNCVTTKWFKIRKDASIGNQNWCVFWRQHDAGKVLRELSKAMTNGQGTDVKECKDIQDKGDTSPEANKQACNYIVKGLEDIYKKEPYGDWTDNDAEKKENQQFYRTMGCLFLNVYADMLEKEPCIDGNVITDAFSKSGEVKNRTPCKNDPNCVTCTRDKSYESCKLKVDEGLLNKKAGQDCEHHKNNIKNKLGDMLDPTKNGDTVIKAELEAINKICPHAQAAKPVATKPTTTKPVVKDQDEKDKPGRKGVDAPEPQLPDANDGYIDAPTPGSRPKNDADAVELLTWGSGRIDSVSTGVTPEITPSHPGEGPRTNEVGPSGVKGPDGDPTHTNPNPGPQGQPEIGTEAVPANSDPNAATPQPIDNGPASPSAPKGDPTPGVGGGGVPGVPGVPGVGGIPGAVSRAAGKGGGGGGESSSVTPIAKPVIHKIDNLPDLLTPYLPTIPVFIGISVISYLLWKYFTLSKRRRRHRREEHLTSPPLEEQLFDHVDDESGPHKYTLVKERKQPRSVPTKTKRPKKQGLDRRVCHRTIIDIHLEVLDECQKGGLHSTKEDFFEILVHEFMGSEFIKEKNVANVNVPNEEVPSSDSGFREEDFVPKEDGPTEQ